MFIINIILLVVFKLFTPVVVIVAKLCNNIIIIIIMKYVGLHNIHTIYIHKYNNYNYVEIRLLCNVSYLFIMIK